MERKASIWSSFFFLARMSEVLKLAGRLFLALIRISHVLI